MQRRVARLSSSIALALGLGSTSHAAPNTTLSDLLITDRTARALGVAPGDTLEAAANAGMQGARGFIVRDVYRPRPDPFEVGFDRLNIKMHLQDLSTLLDAGDRVDRFVIALRDPTTSQATAADLDGAAIGLRAYSSQDLAERGASTFVVVSQFHKAIGLVSLIAGLVFLTAIMVLKIEEMRRELSILRLLGVSRRTVVRSVLAIAAVVALFGGLLGIGLGYAAIAVINPLAQRHFDTDLVFARITPGILLLAVGSAMLLGVLAGVSVALRVVHGRALEQVGR